MRGRDASATAALALCQNRPLLLEGPAGGGKSAVLEEVAARTGNDDFVVLHLDAQTDSKSLFGSYVVGATPGEFAWQPGALTQAVKQGRWVIIEDVDQAPFRCSPRWCLLEERRLYVPGGEASTRTTPSSSSAPSPQARAARARRRPRADPWRASGPRSSPRGDETAACWSAYTRRSRRSRRMLATLNAVQSACGQGGAAAAPGGDAGGRP